VWLRRLRRLWKHDKATWVIHRASDHMLKHVYTTVDEGDMIAIEILQKLTEEMLRNRSQI
jgi:hypothetical protein